MHFTFRDHTDLDVSELLEAGQAGVDALDSLTHDEGGPPPGPGVEGGGRGAGPGGKVEGGGRHRREEEGRWRTPPSSWSQGGCNLVRETGTASQGVREGSGSGGQVSAPSTQEKEASEKIAAKGQQQEAVQKKLKDSEEALRQLIKA